MLLPDVGVALLQDIDDGALRSVIAVTAVDQMFQRCLHGFKFTQLFVQLLDVGLR